MSQRWGRFVVGMAADSMSEMLSLRGWLMLVALRAKA
jgi:hypothetical protein